MNINYWAYWLAITNLRNWKIKRINQVLKILFSNKLDVDSLFNLHPHVLKNLYNCTPQEIKSIEKNKLEIPKFSFIAEELLNEGIIIVPINSEQYPQKLKNKLKESTPPVLFVRGNLSLLTKEAIAVVGSRNADEISLLFVDNIVKKFVQSNFAIVSGGAKGVDQKALDSSMKYNGSCITVLPQGILTSNILLNKYYKYISSGNLVFLSTFYPKSPWNTTLAMIRNYYIFAFASEIYVAESATSGGTWAGANYAIKKNEKIYVRLPFENEKNANSILIKKGAKPVDFYGNIITNNINTNVVIEENTTIKLKENDLNKITEKIVDLLKTDYFTIKKIKEKLSLNLPSSTIRSLVIKIPGVIVEKGNPCKYKIIPTQKEQQLKLNL